MDDLISRQAAIETVDFECGEWRGLAGTIVNGLKNLPAANRWIPCKERLPETYGFYLVSLTNGTTDFCLWDKLRFGWDFDDRFTECDEVIAWQPLPEPYTEEEEDGTVN